MLDLTRIFLFVFGALAIGGGAMGFVKAKSKASLIAGSISGILLLVAGYLTATANARIGVILGLVVSIALAGRFVPAFLKQRKMMPAGLMGILAVIGVFVTGIALMRP